MNHPNVEELTGFLYDELEPARLDEIQTHVADCGECRRRVASWRDVRRELAAWELADTARERVPAARRRALLHPVLKWAMAAAVLMGGGFGLARMSQEPLNAAALRTEVSREIRDQLERELALQQAQYASEHAARNDAFEQAVVRAIGELEARQVVAHAALRKDVETLAVRAQQGFDQIAYAGQADEPRQPDMQQP